MSTHPGLRIGDAERDGAATALGEHYAAGRLTKDEFDERITHVWSARVQADLEPVLADLPRPIAQRRTPPTQAGQRSSHRRHPLLMVAPILVVAMIAAAVVSGMPWLLFGLFWFWAIAGSGHRRGHRHWQPGRSG